jgi:hypothetical protein
MNCPAPPPLLVLSLPGATITPLPRLGTPSTTGSPSTT